MEIKHLILTNLLHHKTENILITAKADGSMDVYDLYNNFNKVQYYMIFTNATKKGFLNLKEQNLLVQKKIKR